MKLRFIILCMTVGACCAMEESFESGDLQRLFSEEIEECASESPQVNVIHKNSIDVRYEQSYEQNLLCRLCWGLTATNSLYTMGRVTPNEQYPIINPIFGAHEPDPYLEHGITCFAAMCTIWNMPSGPADHSCICGHCKKTMDCLARKGVFDDKPIMKGAPHPVVMLAEKKDN